MPPTRPGDDSFALCALLDRLAEHAPTEEGRRGRRLLLDPGDPHLEFYRGALALLAATGALRLDRDRLSVEVLSVQAGYTMRLLSDIVDNGAPLVADWRREGLSAPAPPHPFATAVDLLAALERRRLELLPDAAPVREVRASAGIVLRQEPDESRSFLLVFDLEAGAWQLPGGRRELTDASARATLLRELAEELRWPGLREPADLRLEEIGTIHLPVRLSPTYGVLTRTMLALFTVYLNRPLPVRFAELRWISEREVAAGRTDDGQRIDADALRRLLSRVDP